jgi:hypothetical protein
MHPGMPLYSELSFSVLEKSDYMLLRNISLMWNMIDTAVN